MIFSTDFASRLYKSLPFLKLKSSAHVYDKDRRSSNPGTLESYHILFVLRDIMCCYFDLINPNRKDNFLKKLKPHLEKEYHLYPFINFLTQLDAFTHLSLLLKWDTYHKIQLPF